MYANEKITFGCVGNICFFARRLVHIGCACRNRFYIRQFFLKISDKLIADRERNIFFPGIKAAFISAMRTSIFAAMSGVDNDRPYFFRSLCIVAKRKKSNRYW